MKKIALSYLPVKHGVGRALPSALGRESFHTAAKECAPGRVVHDPVDVKVSVKGTRERNKGGALVVEVDHQRAKLDVEERGERRHRDDEDRAMEDEVRKRTLQHPRHQPHLGDELRSKLDDLEQLDAHTHREVALSPLCSECNLPVILEPHAAAHAGARELHVALEHEEGLELGKGEEENDIVEPVHKIPQVGEVGREVGELELSILQSA